MKFQFIFRTTLLLAICGIFAWQPTELNARQEQSAAKQQDASKKTPRKVRRVRKPQFDEADWSTTYFKDLFAEGLVGERPDFGSTVKSPTRDPENTESPESGAFVWSKVIERQIIEDEIKRLQIQLEQDVTTPSVFATDYGKARQSFALLSMLFGIIREYDSEIRFKEYAAHAQVAFAQAAATSRTGTPQAYNKAKQSKLDLLDMVRGGKFPTDVSLDPDQNWSAIIDRSPVMERLESAYQKKLKPWTASVGEFRAHQEEILHESSLVAAMSQVLTREGMLDADDKDYVAFATSMLKGSTDAALATKSNDFESASKAVNVIGQSCSNCHEDYR